MYVRGRATASSRLANASIIGRGVYPLRHRKMTTAQPPAVGQQLELDFFHPGATERAGESWRSEASSHYRDSTREESLSWTLMCWWDWLGKRHQTKAECFAERNGALAAPAPQTAPPP